MIKTNLLKTVIQCTNYILAGWQSGYAAACKAVYSGSIPDSASKIIKLKSPQDKFKKHYER